MVHISTFSYFDFVGFGCSFFGGMFKIVFHKSSYTFGQLPQSDILLCCKNCGLSVCLVARGNVGFASWSVEVWQKDGT